MLKDEAGADGGEEEVSELGLRSPVGDARGQALQQHRVDRDDSGDIREDRFDLCTGGSSAESQVMNVKRFTRRGKKKKNELRAGCTPHSEKDKVYPAV
jgi:hypothetical protein